jgi:threonyl-tRNA synthetase
VRVLDIHAEHCSFETVAAPPAEDAPDPEDPAPDPADGAVPTPREGGFDDCLAAFVAVEGADARDPALVAARAADHLGTRASNLRCSRVVCYPCPALSERPADHATTVDCCRALADALPDDLDAVRAPVGWHLALDLATAGHPFGEAVSRFTAEETPPERAVEWTVVMPGGERRDPSAALDGLDEPTRTVFERALAEREYDGRSNHTDERDRTTLAEPDGLGGRRLLPAGRLVHDLLAAHVHDRALALGAAPVETAVVPDPSNPDVARLLGALGESISGEGVLRPSTRLGVCALLRDADLRPADCPLRLFESGPVGREGGAATVPALHAALADGDAAWATLHEFATLARDLADDCGLDAVPVCRVGASVPADRLDALAESLDEPVLVGRDTPGGDDAVARLSLHDPSRDSADTPYVRLDPGLAERAGIVFDAADSRGGRDHPVLVDCEPLGSLDGTRAALGPFPTWLAPTQVRFVTIDDDHRARAGEFADAVSEVGLRVDVDDRSRPVGERLDRAERDRVPFVVVVGAREADGAELKCWDRTVGTEVLLPTEAVAERVASYVEGYPRRGSGLPRIVDDGPLWGTRDA